MTYLVFAQLPEPTVPFDALKVHGNLHFGAALTRDEEHLERASRIRMSIPMGTGDFLVVARPATDADYARARNAELRGRASGMAGLAMRCHTVLVVDPSPDTSTGLLLEFCALLAAVGLGPVLPPDDSTLLGVRSARERASRV